MTLTAEQLERIARNKAEAQRRLAAYQAQVLAQSSASTSSSAVVSTPALAHLPNSVAINSATKPVSVLEGPHPSSNSNWLHRTQAQNFTSTSSAHRDAVSSTGQLAVVLPAPRSQVSIQYAPSTSTTPAFQEVDISFHLVDASKFRVHISPYSSSVVEALKQLPSRSFDIKARAWMFPIKDVKLVEEKLRNMKTVVANLSSLPNNVIGIFNGRSRDLQKNKPVIDGAIEESLVEHLYPYQREGVIYGVQKRGRLLLADEMGLGKTIQALGIARYFKSDWPLLIVCPSSVKYTWMQQIQTYLPTVTNVVLIEKGNDQLPLEKSSRTAVILSYDLMVSKKAHLIEYGFQAVIFDESHLIKDGNAQRTKAATDIAQKALRTILLSGTPALSRPVELFSQIRIVDSKIFPNFRDFAMRYCDGKQGRFAFEAKGCTNSEELSVILSSGIMLRRLKRDVLADLPAKRQEVVFLNDSTVNTNLVNLRKAKSAYNEAADKDTKHQRLVEFFYETGSAKADSVAKYIWDNFFYEDAPRRKVLVFAHHKVVLDTISMKLTRKGLRSIRIDGTTSSKARDEQCHLFQHNDDVVVAVLSITAAGVGITLTAATVVIFAELHWNPGTLKQAEDRAHRVGQTNSVFIQYLIAKGTADDIMWPLIQKKLDVLGSVKLSSDTYKDAESVEKNVIDEHEGIVEFFPPVKKSKVNEDGGG